MNNKHFSENILYKLEKNANALSAYSSTSIEGNPLPLTDVKRILKVNPNNIRDSEKEVLNYNRVLEKLSKLIKLNKLEINSELILDVQKGVIEGLIEKYRQGVFRQEPVFVYNSKEEQTIYWPPDSTDVIPLINDLIE